MLFASNESLDDLIIRTVAEDPGVNVRALLQKVRKKYSTASAASIYKHLRKLRAGGVILRLAGKHFLQISWVSEVLSFSQLLEEKYLSHTGTGLNLPKSGEAQSFTFSSFIGANEFASTLVLKILKHNFVKTIYSWHPHPWFDLVQPRQERQYLDWIAKHGVQRYRLLGGATHLDRLIASNWNPKTTTVVFAEEALFSPRNWYVVVLGEFVMSLKLDRWSTGSIDRLFNESSNTSLVDTRLFLDIFRNKRARITVKVENNENASERMKQKLLAYFEDRAKSRVRRL